MAVPQKNGEREDSKTENARVDIERRIGHLLGVSIASYGALDESYGGHPAGTPYVVIRADCALERELARSEVEAIAGLPELAWEHGWSPRRLPSGELVTELRVFPSSNPGTNGASETLIA